MPEPGSDASPIDRARRRLLHGLGHFWRLISNAITSFSHHRGTQLAASMSYYALFSVFPTAIVLAAAAGWVLDDPSARTDAVEYLVEELPLSDEQGRNDLESLLEGVAANSGTLGLIGLVGLLISASALISATRNSINIIDGDDVRRGLLRGKGLDLLLVLALGLLFVLSFGATIVLELKPTLSGRVGEAIQSMLDATGFLLPLVLTAFVFGALYRLLPTHRPSFRDIWPGVAFASIAYELLKRGFSVYLENFADYSAIYGSLGAVIAFMFFVWLASIVFLIGAEMVVIWPRVRGGEFDPDPDEDGTPFLEQLRSFARGLVGRNRVDRE